MCLKTQMKDKILSFSTIDDLKINLNKIAINSNAEDKIVFENMANYFSLLFDDYVEMDVEKDAVTYKQAILNTRNTVLRKIEEKECCFMQFLLELLQIKIDYTANIRKIS